MRNFKRKYSLVENLLQGRGLGVLSEWKSTKSYTVPSASIEITDANTGKKVQVNSQSFAALQNSADVWTKLPTNHTAGWRTQKKVAAWLLSQGWKIHWISSGRGKVNPADILASPSDGGQIFAFEVGLPNKSTQLGMENPINTPSDGILDKQDRVGRAVRKSPIHGEDSLPAEWGWDPGEAFRDNGDEIEVGHQGSYYRSAGDDFLVMVQDSNQDEEDSGVQISMMALTDDAVTQAKASGWEINDMSSVLNQAYDSREDFSNASRPTLPNRRGGTDSRGNPRYGFNAFNNTIKDFMVKVN